MFMVNENIKKKSKLKLGKKTNEGYEYSANVDFKNVDFKEDLSKQISALIQEKKASDALETEIKKLKEIVKKFTDKEKNVQYYYKLGKKLLFLEDELFKDIAIGSVLRRIFEELPDILPNVKDKDMASRHLNFMYWLGHIEKKDLLNASWDQWFEITKFKELYKNKRLLRKILKECQLGKTGHETLNKIIKDLIKNYPK